MDTKIIPVVLLATVFFLSACGHERPQSHLAQAQSTSENLTAHPKIESMITFDVLGGIFSATTSDAEAAVSKQSQNQPAPGTQNILSESYSIDGSFAFVGAEGKGKLTLITSGSGERKTVPTGTTSTTSPSVGYHYAPLNLRFLFFNYAFDNFCLGRVRLDGEIDCTVEGDYDLTNRKFVGKAKCGNGPAEGKAPLIYSAPNANYSVEFNAILSINGDPYEYDNYRYGGQIKIDGVDKKIEDLIGDGLTCS